MIRLVLSVVVLFVFSGCFRPKDTIRVTYVNARTQEVIERMEIGIDELPESFRERTGLILHGNRYGVLDADPSQKKDIGRSGQLRLILLPLSQEERSDIVYSLPTICADLPPMEDGAVDGEAFRMHEDEWRQVELVHQSFAGLIREELEDINRIYQNEKKGIGFSGMHVRSRIPTSTAVGRLSLPVVQQAFPPVRKYGGVVYNSTGGKVAGGFAWQVESGMVIWGTTDPEGVVTHLCLHGLPREGQSGVWANRLTAFLESEECLFVDWAWLFSVAADQDAIMSYLGQRLGND